MTEISISRLHYPINTLGPGRRLGIWFQGCSIRCRGCVSMDTWAPGSMTTVEQVMEAVLPALAEADGVTVSGGEPFDQLGGLRNLLARLREATRADILVYSGYSVERLAGPLAELDGLVDCLIADPFDTRATQTLALRGSDNQRLLCLTPLGRKRLGPYLDKPMPDARSLDIMLDEATSEVFLVGIPRVGDMRRLVALLEARGHRAAVTEDGRPPS